MDATGEAATHLTAVNMTELVLQSCNRWYEEANARTFWLLSDGCLSLITGSFSPEQLAGDDQEPKIFGQTMLDLRAQLPVANTDFLDAVGRLDVHRVDRRGWVRVGSEERGGALRLFLLDYTPEFPLPSARTAAGSLEGPAPGLHLGGDGWAAAVQAATKGELKVKVGQEGRYPKLIAPPPPRMPSNYQSARDTPTTVGLHTPVTAELFSKLLPPAVSGSHPPSNPGRAYLDPEKPPLGRFTAPDSLFYCIWNARDADNWGILGYQGEELFEDWLGRFPRRSGPKSTRPSSDDSQKYNGTTYPPWSC